MSDIIESNVIEIGTNVKHEPLQYIYVTIPAEYVCVYHRILAMLADYGVEMLKDCKASCKDRNSGVIECFNMFNAAVAAYKLSGGDSENQYGKEAATLIKYIKTKINQIYRDVDNSTSFVFPVDENGNLKAFVSCGERPIFYINADDGDLYEHKLHNGFDEHFRLGPEDTNEEESTEQPIQDVIIAHLPNSMVPSYKKLSVSLIPSYEKIDGVIRPCADITVIYNTKKVNVNKTDYQYYFDNEPVIRFNDVIEVSEGVHKFECVVNYEGRTAIAEEYLKYEVTNE